MAEVACPFCGITSESFVIELHIEESHTESSSHVAQDGELAKSLATDGEGSKSSNGSMPSGDWVKCTRSGCGEYVLMADIDEHLEVHTAVSASEDTPEDSSAKPGKHEKQSHENDRPLNRCSTSPSKLQKSRTSAFDGSSKERAISILDYFSGNSVHGKIQPKTHQPPRHPGRLGKRELGPHAFEQSMPPDVRLKLLNSAAPHSVHTIGNDGKLVRESVVDNETAGIVPILADLCARDDDTKVTYLCNPSVKHIREIYCDGNFCGYWSVQMVLTYLQASGHLPDMQQLPDVLAMQDTIEQAWNNGVCSYGRTETGGVRGTRKWIGTSEAAAFLTQIGISVEALSFKDEDATGELAFIDLLDYVEAYFMSGLENAKSHDTSRITQLAPIYFQRLGHSMTIVGLERAKDGSKNLLVFDSSFNTSNGMRKLLDGRKANLTLENLLKAYRRSDQSLARWDEFEVVV